MFRRYSLLKTLTNADAMVTTIVLPVLSYRRAIKQTTIHWFSLFFLNIGFELLNFHLNCLVSLVSSEIVQIKGHSIFNNKKKKKKNITHFSSGKTLYILHTFIHIIHRPYHLMK